MIPAVLFVLAVLLTRAAGAAGARLEGSTGLVQTLYGTESFSGPPVLERVTRAIDLSVFDEHPEIPARFVSMTWSGIWLVPEAGPIDIYAGADDRVRILVDDRVIIERNETVGFGTESVTVSPGDGPHRLRVEYAQFGGGCSLNVLWAPAGRAPRPLSPASLFVAAPDAILIERSRSAARLEFAARAAWAAAGGTTLFLILFTALAVTWRAVRTGVLPAAIRRAYGALMRGADRHGRLAAWLLTGAFVGWTGVRWASGLNPETLWSDDVAVACLAKVDSLWSAVSVTAPLPPVFVALLWVTRRVVADPEVSLQIWPYVFGLVGPAIVGLAVSRLTSSRLLGFIATALGLGAVSLAQYSIFVKAYSLDYLATAVLLLLGVELLVERRTRLWIVAAAGVATAFCSLPAVMIAVALVHVGALLRPASPDGRPAPWHTRIGPVLAFDVLLAAIYVGIYRQRTNADLRGWWLDGFAPTSSFADFWAFVVSTAWPAIQEALPVPLMWLAPCAAIGLVALAATARQRWFALFVATCYAGVLAASILQVYPIGISYKARVSIFAYPLTPALVAVAFGAITTWLPLRRLLHAAAAIAVAVLVGGVAPPVYPPLDLSRLARALESTATPADAVVLNTSAAGLVGYYTSWPITLHEVRSAYGFAVHFPRPLTLTLPRNSEESGAGLDALDRFVADARPSRLFFLSTRRDTEAAERAIRALGFKEVGRMTSRISTRLIEYRRSGS